MNVFSLFESFSNRLNAPLRARDVVALSDFVPWPAASAVGLKKRSFDGFGRAWDFVIWSLSRMFLDNPGVWSRKASEYCLIMRGVAFISRSPRTWKPLEDAKSIPARAGGTHTGDRYPDLE